MDYSFVPFLSYSLIASEKNLQKQYELISKLGVE